MRPPGLSDCPVLPRLIELCTGRNMVVYHQEMELFLALLVMYGTDQHTAGVNAHHRSWRQIDDCNADVYKRQLPYNHAVAALVTTL